MCYFYNQNKRVHRNSPEKWGETLVRVGRTSSVSLQQIREGMRFPRDGLSMRSGWWWWWWFWHWGLGRRGGEPLGYGGGPPRHQEDFRVSQSVKIRQGATFSLRREHAILKQKLPSAPRPVRQKDLWGRGSFSLSGLLWFLIWSWVCNTSSLWSFFSFKLFSLWLFALLQRANSAELGQRGPREVSGGNYTS